MTPIARAAKQMDDDIARFVEPGELLALRAEVREWLCLACRTVYPGPPTKGVRCVICPKCGGDTGPMNVMRVRELRAEVERLQAELLAQGKESMGDSFEIDYLRVWAQLADDLATWVKGAWHWYGCNTQRDFTNPHESVCDCGRQDLLDRHNALSTPEASP